ncbi:MAG: hypothetical protein U1E72_17540 [Burkholderiaceae bacterium]
MAASGGGGANVGDADAGDADVDAADAGDACVDGATTELASGAGASTPASDGAGASLATGVAGAGAFFLKKLNICDGAGREGLPARRRPL